MIRQLISGQYLTQSEYALQHIVILFGEVLIQSDEARLTHTYQLVIRLSTREYRLPGVKIQEYQRITIR